MSIVFNDNYQSQVFTLCKNIGNRSASDNVVPNDVKAHESHYKEHDFRSIEAVIHEYFALDITMMCGIMSNKEKREVKRLRQARRTHINIYLERMGSAIPTDEGEYFDLLFAIIHPDSVNEDEEEIFDEDDEKEA